MMAHWIIKWGLRLIFAWPIYVDIVRHDYEITGGKIFAANHPATLDPVMMLIALRERVRALITQSVFQIPIIGFLLRAAGHIPVADGQGRKAYTAALVALRNGNPILIFPEGRLSKADGSMEQPFSGAIRLAMEAHVPVIPLGVSFSKDKVYHKELVIKERRELSRFYLFGRYNITAGEPMDISGNINDKAAVLLETRKLMTQIRHMSEESAMRLFSR